MALSRALLKRLNSEDDPLPKRIKLAETAFFTVDLPLIRKEDLLLDWLCKICITNQCAWETLNNCLKSDHIDIKTNVSKQCLIDALAHTLSNHVETTVPEEVLECCALVLANNGMRQYFTRKPKDLGLLVKALLNNVSKRFSCRDATQGECDQLPETCELSSAENSTIISIVESIMQIYKQSLTTKEELRINFISDILYPLCSIVDHRRTDSTNKLGVVAYKCIQQLLLGKSKCAQSEQSDHATVSDLFSVLSENAESLSLRSNLLTYHFIFRAAVGTYKSDAASLDAFFRNLVNSAGRYKWEILNVVLELLNDVTLDFENAVEGVTLAEYLEKLISEILTRDVTRAAHHGVLGQLAYINPFVIERNVSSILDKVLMEEQTANYANLLIALLHASTKLRREQKFISHLLTSLKRQVVATKRTRVETSASAFFPREFKASLARSIGNLSNLQMIAGLRTLLYYLNTDCVELLQSNASCKNILMLKATVELLVTFFDGTQLFECTRALSVHEKFVNALDELGNALSLLINKALCLSHEKNVIVILLTAVQSLSEMQNMLRYYIPKIALARTLPFPIADDPWQQLVQRISNFGEDNCKNIMNKLTLHRIKLNASDQATSVKFRGLIGGLEYSWSAILRHDTDILTLLNGKEISKVAYLLLADMTSSEKNFREWLNTLDKECIQENRCFVSHLLNHVLVQIGQCLSVGCTKSITEHIDAKLLMENEHDKNNRLAKVLQVTKELISQQQWVQMTSTIVSKIELYLEILLHVPTIYFSPNVRTLTFLVVYSISRECEKSDKVSALCNTIFSDLLEKTGVDIFQYIEPTMLVNQLPQNKTFSKACEFSLRNVTTYATLKSLVKESTRRKEVMCVLLECMDTVKPKLSAEQKVIFKKAEKRLAKAILNALPEEINDAFDIRCLTTVLKVTISTGKITNSLKKLTESTLRRIFNAKDDLNDDPIDDTLSQQGVRLAVIVLRHRKTFEIQEATVGSLWHAMLRRPCETLLKPLLASTGLKEFHELLKLLHDKTIDSLSRADEAARTSLFVVWGDVMRTDMAVKRNKMRFTALNGLFQTILLANTRTLAHVPDGCWSDLLRLSRDVIGAKHLLIPDVTVDLIVMIGLRALEGTKTSSCEHVLALCGALITVRTNLITDRLPNLLLLYRAVVKTIVHASKNVADKFDGHRFRRFALDIEKLTGTLVKLKKDMARLSPYLIADLLQLISEGAVPSYIKMALQNSLCHLIGICDQHGIALLSRALPTSLQEVFKVQLDTFNKFYKYSGKI